MSGDRIFIQETDRIIVAVAASDNRARRESWKVIALAVVMGVLFLAGLLARLP